VTRQSSSITIRPSRRLRTHRGNLAAVARALDTSRTQNHRLLRRFDLDPDAYRRQ
jgi:hypothetical protein